MHWRDPSYVYQDMDDTDDPICFLLFVEICHVFFLFLSMWCFACLQISVQQQVQSTKSHSSITTDIKGNYLLTIQNNSKLSLMIFYQETDCQVHTAWTIIFLSGEVPQKLNKKKQWSRLNMSPTHPMSVTRFFF